MAFTIKTFDQLVADMVAYIIAHSSQITDLTPGSVIRSFCEGAGLCLEELYVAVYLGFQRYLVSMRENVFEFTRKAGVQATASVVFGRSGTTGSVTIPVGTRLLTASGLRFLTTAVATISAGNTTSNAVEAEAEEVGVTYNVAAATITVIEDDVNGVETVTNAAAATGGLDRETEFAYKQRFQAYLEGLGRSNIAGLRAAALSYTGITSVSVVEHIPPVANVNVHVYVDDSSSGGVSTAIVTAVQALIDGDGTEDNPGYRAAGVNVVVAKPGVVTQNVQLTVTLLSGVDVAQVEADINQAITSYINGLGIGDDIIYNQVIAAVMTVYGVVDCALSTPAANVAVGATQVGRVGTITIVVL